MVFFRIRMQYSDYLIRPIRYLMKNEIKLQTLWGFQTSMPQNMKEFRRVPEKQFKLCSLIRRIKMSHFHKKYVDIKQAHLSNDIERIKGEFKVVIQLSGNRIADIFEKCFIFLSS